LVATRNTGKLLELQPYLAPLQLHLRSLSEFPEVADVSETGATFTENAILKARGYAEQIGLWTLADDSGLEVDALNGAPGVYSARYGGEGLTDADRTQLLLVTLAQTSDAGRRARFVCVIAIADSQGEIINLSTGKCEGRIAHTPRGTNGFGYDPVFIPDGYEQTFGELSAEIKEKISHRALALAAARPFLFELFGGLN